MIFHLYHSRYRKIPGDRCEDGFEPSRSVEVFKKKCHGQGGGTNYANAGKVSFLLHILYFCIETVIRNMTCMQRMYQGWFVVHCVNYWCSHFNCFSSKQQPLKTMGKMEFWKWNILAILRSEYTFDLTLIYYPLQNREYCNLWNIIHFFMIKNSFFTWILPIKLKLRLSSFQWHIIWVHS